MIAGQKSWTFNKGGNWTMLYRFKNRNLTSADVRIIIKRLNGTVVFDSATESTFKSGNSGAFSVTLSGNDTLVLFDVSYLKTGDATLGLAYNYDVEITEAGSRNPEIRGSINVEKNI